MTRRQALRDKVCRFPNLKKQHAECISFVWARYAQNNCIWDLSGLEALPNLDTLNLSNNTLDQLSHLDRCPELHTLLLANNRLETLESIRILADCKGLTTLDLQGNKLEDPQVLCRTILYPLML